MSQQLETIAKSDNALTPISENVVRLNQALTSLVSSTYSGLEYAEQEMQCFALIEAYLTPTKIEELKKLQGKQYGFKVTYAKGCTEIPADTFRDCMIEAFRRGLIPTGNTFNILYGKTVYTTQEGCIFLLKRMGVEIIKSSYPISYKDSESRLIIEPTIWYKWQKKEGVFTQKYHIPDVEAMNNSEDFRRGKAKRKIMKDLIENLTGRPIMVVEEDIEVEVLSNGKSGEGEKPDSIKSDNISSVSEKKEVGEEIHEMVSTEIQEIFDNYIKKAATKADLLDKTKKWTLSKKAKDEFKVIIDFTSEIPVSKNLDLKVFSQLIETLP